VHSGARYLEGPEKIVPLGSPHLRGVVLASRFKDYRALSAVKIGQKRPLDKALHAAVVTDPLMYMQHRRGVTTLVDLYTESLRDACDDLMKQRPLFTDYGQMLLDELCCFAETVEFDHVAQTISSPEYAGYRPTVAA
jgi:hypothetical protein